jgi:hypothetical protein
MAQLACQLKLVPPGHAVVVKVSRFLRRCSSFVQVMLQIEQPSGYSIAQLAPWSGHQFCSSSQLWRCWGRSDRPLPVQDYSINRIQPVKTILGDVRMKLSLKSDGSVMAQSNM